MSSETAIMVSDEALQHVGELGGVAYMTYVRPVRMDDHSLVYGVYTEDGVQLALFANEEAAYFSARQNNLSPVRVH